MTMPNERYRAIVYAKEFLRDLLNPQITPKVPKVIRQRAANVLRHYPTHLDLEMIKKDSPELLGTIKEK